MISLGSYSQSKSEPVTFNIIYKQNVVGTLLASSYIEKGINVYVINTNITEKIMHVKHCTYDLIVKYKNDKFYSSDYKLYINNKLDKSSSLYIEGNELKGKKNGKPKNIKVNSIPFSSALLYFKEPVGEFKTYSEPKLKPRTLKPHANKQHTYVLDGNSGDYYYENGELQKMTMDDLIFVEMVRQ